MRTSYFPLAAATLLLVATSCQKDKNTPAPAVIPAPTYVMGNIVWYPASNSGGGTRHSPLDLTGKVSAQNGQYRFLFTSGNTPADAVEFAMPTDFQWAKLGSYPCQSGPTAQTGAVGVTYTLTYSLNPTTRIGKVFRGREYTTEGGLVITAYDERNRLVSGTYEVKFKDAPDPYAELAPNAPVKKSTVTVFGEFNNMPVQ